MCVHSFEFVKLLGVSIVVVVGGGGGGGGQYNVTFFLSWCVPSSHKSLHSSKS
jgi:hypothetical protein